MSPNDKRRTSTSPLRARGCWAVGAPAWKRTRRRWTISSEGVWNDLASGEGATGGGVSRLFGVPEWQAAADVPANADGSGKTGRGVPDVAALADPETPLWVLTPDGQPGGVGGTSAAAPLWSALITLLNQLTQRAWDSATPSSTRT